MAAMMLMIIIFLELGDILVHIVGEGVLINTVTVPDEFRKNPYCLVLDDS